MGNMLPQFMLRMIRGDLKACTLQERGGPDNEQAEKTFHLQKRGLFRNI